MKKLPFRFKVIQLSTLIITSVFTFNAFATPTCSLKSLKGSYIFHEEGDSDAHAGMQYFDGKGATTIKMTHSDDGTTTVYTAVYSLIEMCQFHVNTGITNADFPIEEIYAAPDGKEFVFVMLPSIIRSGVISGSARRIIRGVVK